MLLKSFVAFLALAAKSIHAAPLAIRSGDSSLNAYSDDNTHYIYASLPPSVRNGHDDYVSRSNVDAGINLRASADLDVLLPRVLEQKVDPVKVDFSKFTGGKLRNTPTHEEANAIKKSLEHHQKLFPEMTSFQPHTSFHAKSPGHGDTKLHITGTAHDKHGNVIPFPDPHEPGKTHDCHHVYLAPGQHFTETFKEGKKKPPVVHVGEDPKHRKEKVKPNKKKQAHHDRKKQLANMAS